MIQMSDFTNGSPTNGRWPPHCCVPAFIYASLYSNGIILKDSASLPALLGVHVGIDDENPLDLPIAENGNVRGVTVRAAQQLIQVLIDDLKLPISFKYLPFNEIPFGLYEDVLVKALEKGVIVGVGIDVSKLKISHSPDKGLHVFRVISFHEKYLTLFDDSLECSPPQMTFSWDDVEQGILAAKGGFWFLGSKEAIAQAYLPI